VEELMDFITDDTTVSEMRTAFRSMNANFHCTASTETGVLVTLATCNGDKLCFKGEDFAHVLDHALQAARVAYYRKAVTELLKDAKLQIPSDADEGSKRAKGFILDAIGTLTK